MLQATRLFRESCSCFIWPSVPARLSNQGLQCWRRRRSHNALESKDVYHIGHFLYLCMCIYIYTHTHTHTYIIYHISYVICHISYLICTYYIIYIYTYLIMYTPFFHAILGPLLNHMIAVGTPNRHSLPGVIHRFRGHHLQYLGPAMRLLEFVERRRTKMVGRLSKRTLERLSMRGSMFNLKPRIFQSLASIYFFPKPSRFNFLGLLGLLWRVKEVFQNIDPNHHGRNLPPITTRTKKRRLHRITVDVVDVVDVVVVEEAATAPGPPGAKSTLSMGRFSECRGGLAFQEKWIPKIMVSKSKLDQVWRLFLGDLVWEPSLKWLHSWYFGQWNCKTTPNDLAEKKTSRYPSLAEINGVPVQF